MTGCLRLQEGVSSFRSYPAGLRDMINYTKHRYNNPPIYITETGTQVLMFDHCD